MVVMSALAQPVRAPFNTTLIISRDSDERKISVPVATDSTRKASTATQIVNRRQSDVNPDIIWSFNQHSLIIQELLNYDCKYIKGRDEYTLLKEVVTPDSVTEVASFSKGVVAKKPVNSSKNEVVSIHPMGVAYASNDTTNKKGAPGSRTFLVPLDFPDDCYCPNIPVPVKGGMKIYPRHGRNVYMSGPDMYLALRLGAKITVFRGFTCQMLTRDGQPSKCLAYAVTNLVQDRMRAKIEYKDNPLVEKSLKTMVNSCYGKTAQNVSPKTRYNAQKMGRVDAEPSTVTSPYHATYTTALVRCMLIACINQLHDMGYHVYSVTTDGFITNVRGKYRDVPMTVIRRLALSLHGILLRICIDAAQKEKQFSECFFIYSVHTITRQRQKAV